MMKFLYTSFVFVVFGCTSGYAPSNNPRLLNIDVTKSPYLAVADGMTHDSAAIQAAINAACATPPLGNLLTPPPIDFPEGEYLEDMPLIVPCDNMTLQGTGGANNSHIRDVFGWGPMIAVLPHNYPGVPTVPSFLPDGGNSLALPADDTMWFNLRADMMPVAIETNGLPSLTVEAYIKPKALPGGPASIITSSGRSALSKPVSFAFSLYTSGAFIGALMTVGGHQYQLMGPTSNLVVGVPAHVAVDYDGAMIRLYANGVVVASQAATGTITQGPFEDVTLGPAMQDSETTFLWEAFQGYIDSVRISNTALYAGTCAPTFHKLGASSSTMVLLNWGNQVGALAQGLSALGGWGWLQMRANGNYAQSSVTIQHLKIDGVTYGTPLFMSFNHNYTLSDLELDCGGEDCLVLANNDYEGKIDNVRILGGPRIGLLAAIAAGVIQIDALRFVGGMYQLVITNGSVLLNQPYFGGSANTQISAVLKSINISVQMDQPLFDAESAGGPTYRPMLLSGTAGAELNMITSDMTSHNNLPPIEVDMWDNATFIGSAFTLSGQEPEVFQLDSPHALSMPLTLISTWQKNGMHVPWTN